MGRIENPTRGEKPRFGILPGGQSLHPVLESVFETLNLAEVRWCLVRLPSSFSAPAGDIDLLVDRVDNVRIRRILRTLGFGALPVWGRRDPEVFYVLYHPSTGRNLCLHVVTELAFGPGHTIRTHAAARCLRRRRKRGVLFEADPQDAFWIMLLHCLLDKGELTSRYHTSLQQLAVSAQMDHELANTIEALSPVGWDASKMTNRARHGDWTSLNRLARDLDVSEAKERPVEFVLRSAAALLGVLSSRSVRRYAWEKRRARKIEGRHAPPVRGLSVALLGPDGVGKSTLAANMAGALQDFAGVRMLYMGLGYAGLPRMARLPIPGSRAAVGLLTLWWRYLVGRYHQSRGRLVIFDRYTYDAWLPPDRPLTALQRLARWTWAHACPAPELVLLLDAPGEAVYERRGEDNPAVLEAARRDFLSLRERIPQLQVVDASKPEEAVRDDVVDRIRRQAYRTGDYA